MFPQLPLRVLAPTFLLGASASAQLLSLDFESDTLNARPTSVTINSPATNIGPSGVGGALVSGATGDIGFLVLSQDNNLGTAAADIAVGSGQILRLFDASTDGSATARFENPSAISNVPVSVLSFDFASTNFTGASGNSFVNIAWGVSGINASSSGSTSNMARVSIARTGASTTTITASNQTSGTLANGASFASFTQQAGHNLKVVINDSNTAESYEIGSVGRLLPANQFEVWLDNVFVGGPFLMRSSLTGGTSNFTYISFGTGGSQSGADWLIDNITVSQAIPEPGLVGVVAGALGLGFVLLRRRQR